MGLTAKLFRFYNSKEYRELRRYILERDNYTCQCKQCKAGLSLSATEVYHLTELTDNNVEELGLAEDNLMTMNSKCYERYKLGQ